MALISEMIDAVKTIENLALERQNSARDEANKIVQSAKDEAQKIITAQVKEARAKAELRINFAKKTAENNLKNNVKISEKEIKNLQNDVQARKKTAIKSIIELVMN